MTALREEYEADIAQIIKSPFPSIDDLRNILYHGGYIPSHLRGSIWLLLLTQSTQEDHEVAFFQPSGDEIRNMRVLGADCDAVMTKIRQERLSQGGEDDTSVNEGNKDGSVSKIRNNLYDLIAFFCSKHGVEYHPLYTNLLYPLLCTGSDPLSRSTASQCFGSLVTQYAPFLQFRSAKR